MMMKPTMRTTINLSAEALAKLRQLAQERGETLGAVASELIRKALEPSEAPRVRNGVPPLPPHAECEGRSTAPDLELVNRLRNLDQ